MLVCGGGGGGLAFLTFLHMNCINDELDSCTCGMENERNFYSITAVDGNRTTLRLG